MQRLCKCFGWSNQPSSSRNLQRYLFWKKFTSRYNKPKSLVWSNVHHRNNCDQWLLVESLNFYLQTISCLRFQLFNRCDLFKERGLQKSRFNVRVKASFWFFDQQSFQVDGECRHINRKSPEWFPVSVKTHYATVFTNRTRPSSCSSESYRPHPHCVHIPYLKRQRQKQQALKCGNNVNLNNSVSAQNPMLWYIFTVKRLQR